MREALRNFFQVFIGWEKGGADTCIVDTLMLY